MAVAEMTKREKRKADLKQKWKNEKGLCIVYIVLRVIVVGVMIARLIDRDYNNVFLCLLTLVLFMIPSFMEGKLKIGVPNVLEVIILIFIFAAEILGEIGEYFVNVPNWDVMLHTTTGFLAAAVGLSLVELLNGSKRVSMKLSPLFVALVAFCFSMTIGVLWEFFEFGVDHLFNMDMQKDTVIHTIRSVALHPEGKNIPVTIDNITSVVVNGKDLGLGGYLDIGLIDTMKDLFVNFIGAVVFSVFGFFHTKYGKKGKLVDNLLLTRIEDENVDGSQEQPEQMDEKE